MNRLAIARFALMSDHHGTNNERTIFLAIPLGRPAYLSRCVDSDFLTRPPDVSGARSVAKRERVTGHMYSELQHRALIAPRPQMGIGRFSTTQTCCLPWLRQMNGKMEMQLTRSLLIATFVLLPTSLAAAQDASTAADTAPPTRAATRQTNEIERDAAASSTPSTGQPARATVSARAGTSTSVEPVETATREAEVEEAAERVIEEVEEIPEASGDRATCIGRVHELARDSVVRVESGLSVGAGFLAIDSTHVITSRSIILEGHGVRVVDASGNARSAEVIVNASDDDLALLELRSPLMARPLSIAEWSDVQVGSEVVVALFADVGRHRSRSEFVFGWASGAINARGDRNLQVDIARGITGSPMVACDGSVVGVVRSQAMPEQTFLTGAGAAALSDLASRVESPEGHEGRVRLVPGVGLALAFEDQPSALEPDTLAGVYLSLGVRVWDAFVVNARGHVLFASSEPTGTSVLRRNAMRYRGDAYMAWRQLVVFGPGMGAHFELGAGASVTLARDSVRTLEIAAGAPRFVDSTNEVWRARPLGVFNIQMGVIKIGYQLEVEIEERDGHVYHLWTLGLEG